MKKSFPIKNMPEYLRNGHSSNGTYKVNADKETINYGELSSILEKLDGESVGEFTLRVPKNNHELCLRGMILLNCMSQYGVGTTISLNQNSRKHVENNGYVDIHVIRNGKLVGSIAAEKIIKQNIYGSCGYGLFINTRNAGNQTMDELFIPFINQKLNLNLQVIKVPTDNPLIG